MQFRTPRLRTAVLTLIAGLLLPIHAYADDETETEYESGLEQAWSRNEEAIDDFFSSLGEMTEEPIAIGFDLLILRPLGLVNVVVGTLAMVPIAIFASPGMIDTGLDTFDEPLEIFFRGPVDYLFYRPLGEI